MACLYNNGTVNGKKISGLTLIAYDKRIKIAKLLSKNAKPMTMTQIADYTGISIVGMGRTLNHPCFARLSHEGNHSLFAITDVGRKLVQS